MTIRSERRKEYRRRKGLRAGFGRVIPPSLGRRFYEINREVDAVRLFEFLHDNPSYAIRRKEYEESAAKTFQQLQSVWRGGGLRGLKLMGFPSNFVIEMDDNDHAEVIFRLSFG